MLLRQPAYEGSKVSRKVQGIRVKCAERGEFVIESVGCNLPNCHRLCEIAEAMGTELDAVPPADSTAP